MIQWLFHSNGLTLSINYDYVLSSSLVPASPDNDGWAKGEGKWKCYKNTVVCENIWQWKDCNSKVRRAILILGISQWSIKFICAESWILTKKASTTLAKRCTGSPLNNLEKLVCKLERLWGWHQGISSQGCVIRITVLLFSILLLFWLLMWAGFSFL